MAAGIAPHDAVNMQQLNDLERRWNDNWNITNERLSNLEGQMDTMGAQSAALAMMNGAAMTLPVGKVAISAGAGLYGEKRALAVGVKVRTTERSALNIGISFSDGKAMGGVGASFTLD